MSFLTELPRERYSRNAFAHVDPAAHDFDLGTAWAMAWMSQLAYETRNKRKVREIGSEWGLTIPEDGIISEVAPTILPTASTELIVAFRDRAVIVAFAGTDPLMISDWITDVIVHVGSSGTATGFAMAAELVAASLDKVLSGRPTGSSIYITGHSLGGALAVLTAERLERAAPNSVAAVYTLGMPRVGNADFARAFTPMLGSRTYRLVHGDDLVPAVPPSALGFCHVGRYLACPRQGRFPPQAGSATDSDEPVLGSQITNDIVDLLRHPFQRVMSVGERLRLAARLALGRGTPDLRTDPGGLLIELLPPRLRDHMPDRYIAATRPAAAT